MPNQKIAAYARKVHACLEGLHPAYYHFNMKTFSAMFKQKEQLIKEGYDLATQASGAEGIVVNQLRQIVRMVFDILASVLGTQKL